MNARRETETRARQHQVAVRFSDAEWARVAKKASAADLPVTAYVRDAAVGRELAAGSQVVAELRRLGGLQKHLFTQSHAVDSSEYAKVLVAITDALERIADGALRRA
jgi:glycerol-3-phosphate dehydrogenase